ncbi:MAG: cytochrome c biogenesis protein CcsA [Acidobacteriota bacterium]
MRKTLPWLLWIWMSTVMVAAFFWAPALSGFVGEGESSRIVYFHVPMAWTAFLAFFLGGILSAAYLVRRTARLDAAAEAAIQLGFVFCVLATVTGAIWSRIEWGAFWNWDPRQGTIALVLLFYAAYLALRSAVEDHEVRRRLAAGYAVLGLVVAPTLFWVVPRLMTSLHPEPVVNARGEVEMDASVLLLMLASWIGFMALFFWLQRIKVHLTLADQRRDRLRFERAEVG